MFLLSNRNLSAAKDDFQLRQPLPGAEGGNRMLFPESKACH